MFYRPFLGAFWALFLCFLGFLSKSKIRVQTPPKKVFWGDFGGFFPFSGGIGKHFSKAWKSKAKMNKSPEVHFKLLEDLPSRTCELCIFWSLFFKEFGMAKGQSLAKKH